MKWENVYIFISSTFNDMHAERDYLVKKVFPKLSAWCEERKLRLIDIDLRWGVSEADATQNKQVVQVCLDRIDACRPFFLCFLGQRRGWVPDKDNISNDTYAAFPKLAEKYAGKASVTEMEILHALVDPLQNAKSAEHAFFYLRNPDYLKDIKHPDLPDIYTNRAEQDPVKADEQLEIWRNEIIPYTDRPVYVYTAKWNENETTHEIALPLYCPTTAPQESEVWNTAFAKWSKMWQSKGVTVCSNGKISDDAELRKAQAYNENLTKGRLTGFKTGVYDLADTVIKNLKEAITARFGERTQETETPLQKELDRQAQFLQVASEGFIERQGDFDAINAYLQNDDMRPFALTAFAGMGKTSLLAHFIDTYRMKSNETLHYRFIGGSDDSVNAERLVRSLLNELKDAKKIKSGIPPIPADMMNKLPELLAEAGKTGKTIFVIDALNQLETGMNDLSWIPSLLPDNVKMIVSFKRGGEQAEAYCKQQTESGVMIMHSVKPFDSIDDRKKLVTTYLDRFFKELDEARINALTSSAGADNPLFLKVALAELRVFGVHNDLTVMIRDKFGDTPVKAFNAVLSRMETDPAYSKIPPGALLSHVLGWVAHSRFGLTVKELSDLLIRKKLSDNENDAYDAVYLVLRQLRPYFVKRDERVDFFYESFKIAATARYTANHLYARSSKEWHRSLAEYFETKSFGDKHKLMEQAWQYAYAEMGDALNELLWNYEYLYNKVTIQGIEQLIADYELISLQEVGIKPEDMKELLLMQRCFNLSIQVLSLYPCQLPQQLFCRLLDEQSPQILKLLGNVKQQTKGAWLRPVNAFGSVRTRLITTRALNNAGGIDVTPDGKHIIICDDYGIKIFNINTLKMDRNIPLHDVLKGITTFFACSPDGQSVFLGRMEGDINMTLNGGFLPSLSQIYIIDYVSGRVMHKFGNENYRFIFASFDKQARELVTYSLQENIRRAGSFGQVTSSIHTVTHWSVDSGEIIKETKKQYEGQSLIIDMNILPSWIQPETLKIHLFKHTPPVMMNGFKDKKGVLHEWPHNLPFTEHNVKQTFPSFDYIRLYDKTGNFVESNFSFNSKFSANRKYGISNNKVFKSFSGIILYDLPQLMNVEESGLIHKAFLPDSNRLCVITEHRKNDVSENIRKLPIDEAEKLGYSFEDMCDEITLYLSLLDTNNGTIIKHHKIFCKNALCPPKIEVQFMNDKFLLSVYGCVSIGDLYTGKIEKVWKINGKEIYCKEIIDDKYAVFIQIDTSCFNFYLMNIQTGDVIKTFEIPDNNGKWLSINNSYYYVSINTDGTMLEVWDIFSEERVGQFISEQRMEIENITINGIALGDAETKKTILQLENLLSTPKIDKPSQNAQKSPIKQGNIEELLKNLGIDSNKKPKPSGFFTRLFGRK